MTDDLMGINVRLAFCIVALTEAEQDYGMYMQMEYPMKADEARDKADAAKAAIGKDIAWLIAELEKERACKEAYRRSLETIERFAQQSGAVHGGAIGCEARRALKDVES